MRYNKQENIDPQAGLYLCDMSQAVKERPGILGRLWRWASGYWLFLIVLGRGPQGSLNGDMKRWAKRAFAPKTNQYGLV